MERPLEVNDKNKQMIKEEAMYGKVGVMVESGVVLVRLMLLARVVQKAVAGTAEDRTTPTSAPKAKEKEEEKEMGKAKAGARQAAKAANQAKAAAKDLKADVGNAVEPTIHRTAQKGKQRARAYLHTQ